MSDPDFTYAVFPSHSSKDKAVVPASSLSASNGERGGVRCRDGHFAVRPVAAARQSAAFSAGRQTRAEENGGVLPSRRYAAKIEEGLEHSQLALQSATFKLHPSLDAPVKGSLAQFRCMNWRPQESKQVHHGG